MPIKSLKTLIYPQNQGFILLILISSLLSSCDSSIELKDFDSNAWKRDFEACTELRSKLAPKVESQQKSLIGKHENTVVQLLGHPNRLDLGRKMTRTAYYSIQNDDCKKDQAQRSLVIDYNSMSQVRLVLIQENN